jgi:hypothetical protein
MMIDDVLAIAGVPAIAGVLVIASVAADPSVPILADVFTYCIVRVRRAQLG